MPIDPELVRVDLLKVKRKIYQSFPEGSPEKREFLLASKFNELGYLSKLVPPDVVDMVFAEYKKVVKQELINLNLSFGIGVILSFVLFQYHNVHLNNLWLSYLWTVPFFIGLVVAINHVLHLVKNWRDIQPFRKEYEAIQEKIKKLSEELKDTK